LKEIALILGFVFTLLKYDNLKSTYRGEGFFGRFSLLPEWREQSWNPLGEQPKKGKTQGLASFTPTDNHSNQKLEVNASLISKKSLVSMKKWVFTAES